jgi:hypothetical protein
MGVGFDMYVKIKLNSSIAPNCNCNCDCEYDRDRDCDCNSCCIKEWRQLLTMTHKVTVSKTEPLGGAMQGANTGAQ